MRCAAILVGLGVMAALVGCRGKPGEPDPGPPPVEWSAEMQTVADGQNRFALDLYAKLATDKDNAGKNVFFSPYSVHTALAMTTTGAKGKTRDEMVKTLHLPEDQMLAAGDIGRYYGHPRKDFELSVANALWGQKGFPWRPEWLDVQNKRFGSGFHEADFAAQPNAERERINKWVQKTTRDRIKELLQPPQITRDTTMVLTNAIYFKGKWATPFDKKETRNAPFKCDDGTKVDVPMMNADVMCRLGAIPGIDGASLLELPYQGDELAMVILLPKASDKLAALEKALTPELLAKGLGKLTRLHELPVSLPKFKIETLYQLPAHLQALGMIDAFKDGAADFTGMATKPPGCISNVAHKAFVDVNEEGTEAVAGTGAEEIALTVRERFVVDRPFLFFIRDAKRGTILFMGRVMKP